MLAAAIVAGGLSAYAVLKWNILQPAEIMNVGEGNGAVTFADFSGNGMRYPDLTFAAEKAVQAVVNIEKKEVVNVAVNPVYGSSDPLYELFGVPQKDGGSPRQTVTQERQSAGSGVIISQDGFIVTNNHVSENANELSVKLSDGCTYAATLVGADPATDIALVKIDAAGLPALSFGSSDDLRLGEWLLAVGNPFGLNSTVTAGIVSAKGRSLDVIPEQFRIESFIQTDAAVNRGNSGGALVNTRGELVGINTVIKSPTGAHAGYAFAVPSSIVRKVVDDLMEYGVVQRALLGIGFHEVDDNFIKEMSGETGIKGKGGIYVASVDPNGAAHQSGIKTGDVITAVDGVKTMTASQLQEAMAKYRPNDKVTITLKRGGTVKHFDVVLRNTAGETKLIDKNAFSTVNYLGGRFAEITDRAGEKLNVEGGVMVTSVGEGVLKKAGVRKGFIITGINGKKIRNVSDLNKLNEKPQSIEGIYSDAGGRTINYILAE